MYKIDAVNKNEKIKFTVTFEDLYNLHSYLFFVFKKEFECEVELNISFGKIKEITKHYNKLFDDIDLVNLDYLADCQSPLVLTNYKESIIYKISKI